MFYTSTLVTVISDNDNCVINLLIPGTRVRFTEVKIEFIKHRFLVRVGKGTHVCLYDTPCLVM